VTDQRKTEIVRYRMEQASEALDHAHTLITVDGFGASLNRSYYGMFYAVLALLLTRDLGISKHSSAIASLLESLPRQASFHVTCRNTFTRRLTCARIPTIASWWS